MHVELECLIFSWSLHPRDIAREKERERQGNFFFLFFFFLRDRWIKPIDSQSICTTDYLLLETRKRPGRVLVILSPKAEILYLDSSSSLSGLEVDGRNTTVDVDRPTENKIDGSLFGISFCCSSQRQQGEMSISSSSSTIEKSLPKKIFENRGGSVLNPVYHRQSIGKLVRTKRQRADES